MNIHPAAVLIEDLHVASLSIREVVSAKEFPQRAAHDARAQQCAVPGDHPGHLPSELSGTKPGHDLARITPQD
jgi:hypothetical protein